MRTLIALLVMAAIIAVEEVSASGPEDGHSIVDMANQMKENFWDLFQRFDRLKSKVNRIIGKETCQPGETGSGGEILNDDSSLDRFHEESGTVATPGSTQS